MRAAVFLEELDISVLKAEECSQDGGSRFFLENSLHGFSALFK
jgi:hypothetical protein